MAKIKILSLITVFTFVALFAFVNSTSFSKNTPKSPELAFDNSFGTIKLKGKALPASCAYTLHGSSDEYTSCSYVCPGGQTVTGTSRCGGTCTANCPGTCSNGATNYPTCNNNYCTNNATNYPACNQCGPNQEFQGGQCVTTTCTVTNVCGQPIQGTLSNGNCSANVADPNLSCFSSFNISADRVGPNGSVEFTWKMADTPGISSRCGFVDLTTPTPRPIPGLQNLDPSTDRVRITNIQTTTRFCLVCQFYNLSNNNILGNAQVHQWVRVIRIGEN